MIKNIAVGDNVVVIGFEKEVVSVDRRVWEYEMQTLTNCKTADEMISAADNARIAVADHSNVAETDIYYSIKDIDGIKDNNLFLAANEKRLKADFGIVDENNIVDDEDLEVKI